MGKGWPRRDRKTRVSRSSSSGFRHFSKRPSSLIPCTFKENESQKAQRLPGVGVCVTEVPASSMESPEDHYLRKELLTQSFLPGCAHISHFQKDGKHLFLLTAGNGVPDLSWHDCSSSCFLALSQPCQSWFGLWLKEQDPRGSHTWRLSCWPLGTTWNSEPSFWHWLWPGHNLCPALDSERHSDLPPAKAEWRTVGNGSSTWKGTFFLLKES